VSRRLEGATIRHCRAEPGTATFLALTGKETRDIWLANNDLRRARTPHALENDVDRSALRDEDSPQAGSSPGNK
jgi:hypothetical protein